MAFWMATASSSEPARMTPSTGPKHSVRWNHEPGRTPKRTPGVQVWGPRRRGSTSHSSPSSRRVRARRSLPSGSLMVGPMVVARSVLTPTLMLVTASVSWRRRRPRVIGTAHAYGQAGGRALLAGVAERRRHEVGHGQVDVGVGRDHHRVLARRLRQQAQIGLPRQEQLGGVIGPGQDHGMHAGMSDQVAADAVVGGPGRRRPGSRAGPRPGSTRPRSRRSRASPARA